MDEARIRYAVLEAIFDAQKTSSEDLSVKAVVAAVIAGIAEYDEQRNEEKR